MLSGLTTSPRKLTKVTARIGIDTIIALKRCLEKGPEIGKVVESLIRMEGEQTTDTCNNQPSSQGLDGTETITSSIQRIFRGNPLLLALRDTLRHDSLQQMQQRVDSIMLPSTEYTPSASQMRHQECFALRSGLSAMLDVARETFHQVVGDIYKLPEVYARMLKVDVRIQHSNARGYYLSMPMVLQEGLPDCFIQCVVNKKSISCTTQELVSLSDRADEALQTALFVTNDLIEELLNGVRENIDYLFSYADSIALLDMLCSFCDLVAMAPNSQPFVRPTLVKTGDLRLIQLRHPITVAKQANLDFVANDCILPSKCLKILTGPNGSGKSTYIKQVAIAVVLAQIGCFVPANEAIVPIRERLLSRLGGGDDDIEHNLSSFMLEMRETSYLLAHNSSQALVIIDELGRATSTADGTALAVAVAERLAVSGTLCLFVTHFPQLCGLADMYPNVDNIHLRVEVEPDSPDNDNVSMHPINGLRPAVAVTTTALARAKRLRYLRDVGEGPFALPGGYGIQMAEICGFPPKLLHRARELQVKAIRTLPLLQLLSTGPDLEPLLVGPLREKFKLKCDRAGSDTDKRAMIMAFISDLSTVDRKHMAMLLKSVQIPSRQAVGCVQSPSSSLDHNSHQPTSGLVSIEARSNDSKKRIFSMFCCAEVPYMHPK
jgi:DNA mismatch repair protein MSH4